MELMLWALRKRRPWRVQGTSMCPVFDDGDLVIVDPAAANAVDAGDVIVARHPFKNVEIIKYVDAVVDDLVAVRSPSGDDSRQFGRVPVHTIRGRVTANLTKRAIVARSRS